MSTDENKLQRGEWFEGQFYPDEGDDQEELPAPLRTSIAEADLQLLELAGRAIGAVRMEVVAGESWVNLHFADGSVAYAWNSLMHSDDMLNLQALLHIDLAWMGDEAVVADGVWSEPTAHDPAAAARRAVTRAAGDIVKQHST